MSVAPTSAELERRTLLYVLSEALEKVSRLGRILAGQRTFIPAVDTLVSSLDNHCKNFMEMSPLIASYLTGASLNEGETKGIITALQILITGILQVHELLLLLPREDARPQASFLLRDSFGMPELNASIVLTNFISAYEYRFEDVLEKVNLDQEELGPLTRGGNVLCQAFADKDNPLAWAVLAHEYGHALDDTSGVSREILEIDGATEETDSVKVNLKRDIDARVVSETVADFVAARALGPASLMPILFVEMMYPRLKKVGGNSAGHPPTPLRVQLVRNYLKSLTVSTSDFEPVFEAYELDYNRKLREMENPDREGIETLGKDAGNLLSEKAEAIAAKVNSLVPQCFKQQNVENARALKATLALPQPISSRRRKSEKEIFAQLALLNGGETTVERAYEVLNDLDELPVAASEIVTAGWLYKLSSLENVLMKTFAADGVAEAANLDVYRAYVEKIDFMLMKSLELVSVHSEVLRRA